MTTWTLPYLRTTIPSGAGAEEFERRITEVLVALHRFRREGVVASRRFYAIRNVDDPSDVKVGFVDDPIAERLLAGEPLAQYISDATLDTVRQIVG